MYRLILLLPRKSHTLDGWSCFSFVQKYYLRTTSALITCIFIILFLRYISCVQKYYLSITSALITVYFTLTVGVIFPVVLYLTTFREMSIMGKCLLFVFHFTPQPFFQSFYFSTSGTTKDKKSETKVIQ